MQIPETIGDFLWKIAMLGANVENCRSNTKFAKPNQIGHGITRKYAENTKNGILLVHNLAGVIF
jgi:hypothetical protein